MRTFHVETAYPVTDKETEAAKAFYLGSDEQPPSYDNGVPQYAEAITNTIASTQAKSVLEFGCNAGRNLALLKKKLPDARLTGMDLNEKMINFGVKKYGLDLKACDELGLANVPDNSYDVTFTVSVLDHIPYPEFTLRHLLRITKSYLVLYEISNTKLGRSIRVTNMSAEGKIEADSYPYSYFHDYRAECEKKFGAICAADIQLPVSAGSRYDLYRMYVFCPRRDLSGRNLVSSLNLNNNLVGIV